MNIRIQGLGPDLDGSYPFDYQTLTNLEYHDPIKRISGLRANEVSEGFVAGDRALLVAFACVALDRAGKAYNERALWDAESGQVAYVFTEDDDAVPPAEELPEDETDSSAHSGETSSRSSASPANDQSPTGSPDSGTGATSALAISEI